MDSFGFHVVLQRRELQLINNINIAYNLNANN